LLPRYYTYPTQRPPEKAVKWLICQQWHKKIITLTFPSSSNAAVFCIKFFEISTSISPCHNGQGDETNALHGEIVLLLR
jgi:hypothetical protein